MSSTANSIIGHILALSSVECYIFLFFIYFIFWGIITKVIKMENLETKKTRKLPILLDLFLTFFKLGAFTFGGGYAMISLLRETVVEKKKWLSDDEMLEVIGIAESTPGPIAINMSTFVGYKQAKLLGSFLATLGVVLPSMIVIFTISLFFEAFLENKYVTYAFIGIKTGVSFLILNAGIEMIKKVEKKSIPILVLILVFITMILIEVFHLHFSSIYLILIGGIIGIVVNAIRTHKKGEEK